MVIFGEAELSLILLNSSFFKLTLCADSSKFYLIQVWFKFACNCYHICQLINDGTGWMQYFFLFYCYHIYVIYVCDVCMWSTGWYIYTYVYMYIYVRTGWYIYMWAGWLMMAQDVTQSAIEDWNVDQVEIQYCQLLRILSHSEIGYFLS